MYEETGLTIKNPKLCGIKQFQSFDGERYVVFCYKTKKYLGELCASNEGAAFWINRRDLEKHIRAEDFFGNAHHFRE
ncbi:MAG: hypothetical protein RRY79_00500 [Clostridia bacterium]